MIDIVIDGLIDTLKILPFLFVAFLLMEKIEHEMTSKHVEKIKKNGPLAGALLGLLPQCGFSAAATSLFSAKIITIGSLIAVYLSTSDEMLAIMITKGLDFKLIILILFIKLMVAIVAGTIIDKIIKSKNFSTKEIKKECNEEHCGCGQSIFKSSLKHTLDIAFFILLFNILINGLVEFIGIDTLSNILLKDTIFGPFLASLIGLIPNCAASIVLTELFVSNAINFGSMMAGLLTGSGIALLILFKSNKNLKENLFILSLLYLIGSVVGLLIQIIW